ncbi:MAG: hypothetical protein KGQ51_17785 [Planctomycetes bacterium]|nr:hypothetical protein [Planctomycetota bacterium]
MRSTCQVIQDEQKIHIDEASRVLPTYSSTEREMPSQLAIHSHDSFPPGGEVVSR